jgi:hypothetical protein
MRLTESDARRLKWQFWLDEHWGYIALTAMFVALIPVVWFFYYAATGPIWAKWVVAPFLIGAPIAKLVMVFMVKKHAQRH